MPLLGNGRDRQSLDHDRHHVAVPVCMTFYSKKSSRYEESHTPDRKLVGSQIWTMEALTDALLVLAQAIKELADIAVNGAAKARRWDALIPAFITRSER